jgi:predicted DCC family thiol-disulfide oxidoreductase YuxK
MKHTKQISPWQFTAFRILFGAYLFLHFAQLLPWANELFSSGGVLADTSLNPLHGLFPNPLGWISWAQFPATFVAGLMFVSLAFMAGLARRSAALILWFGWACLFNRNNLIANPGIPYVGLLLVLCALVPTGEPWSFRRRVSVVPWFMPAFIYRCPWLLLAAGYTYSGAWKLFSPSWFDGTALMHLMENPLARPGPVRDLLLQLPLPFLKMLTWLALAGEILFLPLCFARRGRLVAWLWMVAMHLGILLVVDFADLTFGMLVVHLFTFDPDWLPPRAVKALVFFDGECAMCNRWVQFIDAEASLPNFTFARLGGKTARDVLPRHQLAAGFNDSVVFIEQFEGGERGFAKSDAILRILAALGGFWRVVSWLRIIPIPVRDKMYNYIARHRLRWFRKQNACSFALASRLRVLP